MENPVNDFFQIQDSPVVNGDTPSGISSYISCIRLNGRPILPPLITDDRRKELNYYKGKAIEIEARLSENKKKCATFVKSTAISTSENSLIDLSPNQQSTPARPVTLQLMPNVPARTHILSSSSSDSNINKPDKVKKDMQSDNVSSQKSTNKVRSKLFRSTLEQRLANEEVSLHNKKNLYEQSPIIEENYSDCVNVADGDVDLKQDMKRWSPLNIDSINSLRVDSRDPQTADNSFVSIDDVENSVETLTGSPNLLRQNSYTLLTPSPALLHYLETQKDEELNRRSHSGRKTWDFTNAKKSWSPGMPEMRKESTKGSSLEEYPVYEISERRNQNWNTDDGSTSPSSYSFKGTSPKLQKIKCKIKSRRVKPHKNVPSPKPTDKVPKYGNSAQGPESVFVPFQVKEELTDLSNLLMKIKMEHERQKKELEEKQRSEMKELELLFKRRESELLRRVTQESPVCPRSIYSQYSDPGDGGKFHLQMVGDGRHNTSVGSEDRAKRPQSAKDYYMPPMMDQESRRTRSMDFNQPIPNQDTDLDISFQDSLQSKEFAGNEDIPDTDTISNCSSQSSTLSSDSKLESMPLLDMKKFKTIEMTPEEFQKYNQAAAVITAAARGFLTRRLLRTSHVQGLITTLRDAISCATQLHGASDLGESDVDLMKRLGRQIEAAWEAVYAVFFETDPATKMQLISSDRERLRTISTKLAAMTPKKRISSATLKSLRRKSGSELLMSRSQITNGSNAGRKIRPRMVASYPSPSASYKLK